MLIKWWRLASDSGPRNGAQPACPGCARCREIQCGGMFSKKALKARQSLTLTSAKRRWLRSSCSHNRNTRASRQKLLTVAADPAWVCTHVRTASASLLALSMDGSAKLFSCSEWDMGSSLPAESGTSMASSMGACKSFVAAEKKWPPIADPGRGSKVCRCAAMRCALVLPIPARLAYQRPPVLIAC